MSKASNLLSRLSETVYSGDANISGLEDDLISLGWSDDQLSMMASQMSVDEYEDRLAQMLNDHQAREMKKMSRNAPYEEENP